jgi:hypothetical protein
MASSDDENISMASADGANDDVLLRFTIDSETESTGVLMPVEQS